MIDVAVNFLHLLATSVWIGGALFIHLVLQPSLGAIEPPQAGKLYGVIAKRFSIAAWISIIILLFTGLYKTPAGMLFDTSSETGTTLMIKHVLVLIVVAVGLVIGLVVVPRLRKAAPAPGEKPSEKFLGYQKQLTLLSSTNTLLAMGILICASMLW